MLNRRSRDGVVDHEWYFGVGVINTGVIESKNKPLLRVVSLQASRTKGPEEVRTIVELKVADPVASAKKN